MRKPRPGNTRSRGDERSDWQSEVTGEGRPGRHDRQVTSKVNERSPDRRGNLDKEQ